MDLGLRKWVFSKDGQRFGQVDGFVVDYSTRDVKSFIVRSGWLLEHDRLIDRDQIDHVDEDGTVTLKINLAQVKKLPEFFEREFIVAKPHQLSDMPQAWVAMGTGSPPVYFGTEADSLGYGKSEPFYGAAPVIPPEVEIESNVPAEDIVIDTGTEVFSSDGEKLGNVDEINYGLDGSVIGFVVRSGLFVHHELPVPAEWISTFGEDHVKLRVTAQEAREPHPTA